MLDPGCGFGSCGARRVDPSPRTSHTDRSQDTWYIYSAIHTRHPHSRHRPHPHGATSHHHSHHTSHSLQQRGWVFFK